MSEPGSAGPARLERLQTPALVLDHARMRRNIARMHVGLARLGAPLRPHVKTAKCAPVMRQALAGQPGGVTVSTLAEAEHCRDAGVRDILYAVGIAPGKLERAAALRAQGVELTLAVDTLDGAEAVASGGAGLGVRFPAVVEIDSDGRRAGVPPASGRAQAIAERLAAGPGASFAGVMTHAGGSYGCVGAAAIRAHAEQERRAVVDTARMLAEAGTPAAMVSVGSTPTATFAADLQGVTEVRAGVFVFHDLVMAGLGVCGLDDIALSVLASVIGVQPERGWIIVDAGWTALSRDRGTREQPLDQGYGVVCDVTGAPIDDLIVVSASQEHGVIADRTGRAPPLDQFPVGRPLRILPNHACATASQHAAYHVVDGGAEILEVWPRIGGW